MALSGWLIYSYRRGDAGLAEVVGAMAVTGWYGLSLASEKQRVAVASAVGAPVGMATNGPVKPCGTCPDAWARRLAAAAARR